MFGKFKGAQKCLQTLIGRSVPHISCQGHRSNTFIEHCSKTTLFTQMYDLLEAFYIFFSKSCKRDDVLRKELKKKENALKLRNLSKTRWVYIMKITKMLTIQMQKEELNILDALMAIEETVASLETIRRNELEVNNQVKASVEFAKSFDQDPEEDFRRKRVRRMSRGQDDNPDTAASIEIFSHY
ncbi:Hypothetical predicted protein [Paramuricea clavata]|uniref:Uncharacterized protein n=1 Tax=Paramuricea clavata TaxID=317549 RepID=A0A6S7KUE0_PARCT|nr:Hypothetical predicted protein [Paramuricea clavata]